jgi:hypothetical protein
MKKINSYIGVFSISTFINKDGTFSRHSLFYFELKLLQVLYTQWGFSLIEYTIIKNNLLNKNAHTHTRTN